MRVLLMFAVSLLAGTAPLWSHPGHDLADDETSSSPASRIWTRANGASIEATFVAIRDGKVRLLTRDGSRLSLPLEDFVAADRQWIEREREMIEWINSADVSTVSALSENADCASEDIPEHVQPIYSAFAPFRDKLKLRWDDRYFLVESNGLPDHGMMVGIKNWQQQVPLPQPYTGANAWRIPLSPKLSDKPISGRKNLYRGAIALAVNGVPIFNALNNRGEDAYLIGELDEWGGHCGRADDYHYHAAPVHLEKIVGPGKPIAYALDGFPIHGLTEADGSPVGKLDELNGQFDKDGHYHYHATKTYPYINGGMRGAVAVLGDQIEPQPHLRPVRPAGEPLRGATITEFKTLDNGKQKLTYEVRGQKGSIEYKVSETQVDFQFTEPSGRSRSESYSRSSERPGGPPPRNDRRPPPPPRR